MHRDFLISKGKGLLFLAAYYSFLLCLVVQVLGPSGCHAFGPSHRAGRKSADDGGYPFPPPVAMGSSLHNEEEEEEEPSHSAWTMARGGNANSRSNQKNILHVVSEFWSSTFGKVTSKVKGLLFRNQKPSKQEELLEQLKTMPIRAVTIQNTTVLPPEVVRVAVKRSGLMGQPLQASGVQEIAKVLKRWYERNGYVLHSVTGANLQADTATAEITVDEPKLAAQPVQITVCKEMVVDEDGNLWTFRQYLEQQANKKAFRHDRIEKKDLNTTYLETEGRTKPWKVAQALGLEDGKDFQWDSARWSRIASCGIFSKILRVSPRRLQDGTVQLDVIATEPPPRHLEYGLGKSLYTGSWEGEVDFEHTNLLGGGEVFGIMVRRGTKDVEPSVKIRYSDDHFGLEGGFDVEVFSDFLGDTTTPKPEDQVETQGDLCFRKGGTVRIQNPIPTSFLRNSLVSTSIERTSSRSGKHERIGSTTLTLGPVRTPLPFQMRSSVVTSLTGGTRLGENLHQGVDNAWMPYASGSATARQVLPLMDPVKSLTGRTPVLALQHTIASASLNLPSHEAKAMGVAAQIRGCGPDGGATSIVKGTAEVRFPALQLRIDNASVLFFGDWFYAQQNFAGPYQGKGSVGVGLRKVISGIPLKYEVCYTSEGKIKTMFGLGPDFDA